MPTARGGHLQGGKFTTSHTSIISVAIAPTRAAEKLACVSKISLGIIKSIPTGQIGLKYMEMSPGCLMVKVRGTSSIQEIWIYTSNAAEVRDVMHKALNLN
jgi:hypothetical protein